MQDAETPWLLTTAIAIILQKSNVNEVSDLVLTTVLPDIVDGIISELGHLVALSSQNSWGLNTLATLRTIADPVQLHVQTGADGKEAISEVTQRTLRMISDLQNEPACVANEMHSQELDHVKDLVLQRDQRLKAIIENECTADPNEDLLKNLFSHLFSLGAHRDPMHQLTGTHMTMGKSTFRPPVYLQNNPVSFLQYLKKVLSKNKYAIKCTSNTRPNHLLPTNWAPARLSDDGDSETHRKTSVGTLIHAHLPPYPSKEVKDNLKRITIKDYLPATGLASTASDEASIDAGAATGDQGITGRAPKRRRNLWVGPARKTAGSLPLSRVSTKWFEVDYEIRPQKDEHANDAANDVNADAAPFDAKSLFGDLETGNLYNQHDNIDHLFNTQ